MKACVRCRHMAISWHYSPGSGPLCERYGKDVSTPFDVVMGDLSYRDLPRCRDMRAEGAPCGPEGRGFEEHEARNPKPWWRFW